MLAGKTLTDFTNLFSPNNFKKNGDITLNYLIMLKNNWMQFSWNTYYISKLKWSAAI